MTVLTALLNDYFDHELTTDERLCIMAHVQEYGRVWLPYITAELGDVDYSSAIIELAAFCEVPGFAAFAARTEVGA